MLNYLALRRERREERGQGSLAGVFRLGEAESLLDGFALAVSVRCF